MQSLRNHIVLIGFKHVGKSVIGKNLAKKLHVPFIDLDQKIEILYENKFNKKMSCRQIMEQEGEKFFRYLEMNALSEVIDFKPSIVSLGGGTPLTAENQRIIKSCIVVHITASRGIVFERILMSGLPAFFNPEEDLLKSFNRLWDEREKIYEEIKDFSIENGDSIDNAVSQITKKLNLEE
jgi:shikimate kinase